VLDRQLKALAELDAATCRGLRGVFADIDDTLSWEGHLVPEAFVALHRLRESGLVVVPVTGRPGGWVDHIARFWPVEGVVGENGGLWFWRDEHRLVRRFAQPLMERRRNRERLDSLAAQVLAAVPGTALASDQPYRELDLAIDVREDVPPLADADIDKVVATFHAIGATCKVSSIHVNGWFGSFDKLSGCRSFVRDRFDRDLDAERDRWLFVGDSPNDEPLFAAFPVSVGVANVTAFTARMSSLPRYVTSKVGGFGFAELAARILELR
jgi:HAD superfamily hydrolase (TIGR01484 family)